MDLVLEIDLRNHMEVMHQQLKYFFMEGQNKEQVIAMQAQRIDEL